MPPCRQGAHENFYRWIEVGGKNAELHTFKTEGKVVLANMVVKLGHDLALGYWD